MKIGLLPLYISLYDQVAPETGRFLRPFAGKIADELAKRGFEVVQSPACCVKNEFADAVKLFEESNCQAIATLHLAYSPSLEAIEPLSNTELPIVVIDTTFDYEFTAPDGIMNNHGIHGVQDLCNLLLRNKKQFLISAGHWQNSDVLDRAAQQLESAVMAWNMVHCRVGKIGGDFDGMGDFRIPDGALNIQVVEYTPASEVSDEEIAAELALDKERFKWDNNITENALRNTLQTSLKIRKWLEQQKLDAFTMAFPGINRQDNWSTVPFLECSKAMERGIGYAGEGDVLTAAVTGVLAKVFPETSFTEMFCPDWKNDRIFTSHMGEINPAICADKPYLHEMPYRFSDTGNPVIATGCFKAGKAVLVNLAPGADGVFTLIAAPVTYEVVSDYPRTSNCGWFTPVNSNIADFIEEYSRAGGTHHLTCCYNGNIAVLKDWAHLMNFKFVVL